jgi:5'-AMP-activated protein kinase regulatory beta subunit
VAGGDYGRIIPPALLDGRLPSPTIKGEDPQAPHQLPPQLERVILNLQQSTDETELPIPQQVALNHLNATSIRDGVLALATTTRYYDKVFIIF